MQMMPHHVEQAILGSLRRLCACGSEYQCDDATAATSVSLHAGHLDHPIGVSPRDWSVYRQQVRELFIIDYIKELESSMQQLWGESCRRIYE